MPLRYRINGTEPILFQSVDEWLRRMGGGAHAESVIDRIIHNAVRIQMGDVNMRQRTMGSQA